VTARNTACTFKGKAIDAEVWSHLTKRSSA
jgi:hypothetical protein